MLHNGFFEKKGPFPFEKILKEINSVNDFVSFKKKKIYGIDTLTNAKEKEITFLNSSKYAKISIKTNAFALLLLTYLNSSQNLVLQSMLKMCYLQLLKYQKCFTQKLI